jgi:hypothetical protein
MLATVVETDALLQTVLAAFVAGVGVTLVFSLAILGAARFADMSRDGRPVAAAAFGALTLVALAVAAAGVTIGIIVMTSK